jgi:hypothetical protein
MTIRPLAKQLQKRRLLQPVQRLCIIGLMNRSSELSVLARLADPVTRCLTPEVARQLVKLRIDRETQARLDELADKSTEGLLAPEERAEYQTYVAAIDFLTILKAKARGLLAKKPRVS